MLEDIDEVYVSVRTRYVKGRPSGEPLGVILVKGNFANSAIMKLFAGQPKMAARFVDAHTILLGDEESMAEAVERMKGDDGLVSPVLTRAKELAAANDLWMVGSPAPLAGIKPRGSLKRQGGLIGDLEEVFDNLRSFSFGVALRERVRLDVGLNLRTKAAADKLMALYQRFEADMKKTPEGLKNWEQVAQSLEVHPNGTAVRITMQSEMANVQSALAKAWQGRMAPAVQIAEQRPEVVAAMPVAASARVVPVRRTVRIYGMESGYREIATGGGR